jgi:DNA-binding transcriptional MerR regulator
MFTIGQFARLAQVSLKLLRYYDKIGLLEPVYVNPETGYRYYSVEQLDQLNLILALQHLGLSLKEIARLLDEKVSVEELRGMLRLKQARLRSLIEKETQRLREVETRLAQIESADPAFQQYHIALKSTAAIPVAGVRKIMTDGSQIAPLFQELQDVLAAHAYKIGQAIGLYDLERPLIANPCGDTSFRLANGRQVHAIEHPGGWKFDLEAVYRVNEAPKLLSLRSGDKVVFRELAPLPTVAALVHRGSYSVRHHAYMTFSHWANANGYVVNGAIRELYLRFNGYADHPDNLMEIQLPVVKKE